jgi:hypothetical protein
MEPRQRRRRPSAFVTRYFCTYCDRGYLSRALALYESLVQHCPSFRLWVLCFDAETLEALRTWQLPNLVPIALQEFEEGDAALVGAKANRSVVEYYFTCTPSVLLYVLGKNPEIDVISYVDADLFFFSDPAPIYEELGQRSVLIIGHRFPEHLRFHEALHGVYNVGLLAFRNDGSGRAALEWWRDRCIEKCSDQASDGHFADQKYLDDWPARFQDVVVLQHQGAGLAPWNVMRYELKAGREHVTVNGDALVFYHFHSLRVVRPGLFDACLDVYGGGAGHVLTRHVYAPYLRILNRQMRRVGAVGNPRAGDDFATRRDLVRFLVDRHSLWVVGPIVIGVHLEPLARPFLRMRQALYRSAIPDKRTGGQP